MTTGGARAQAAEENKADCAAGRTGFGRRALGERADGGRGRSGQGMGQCRTVEDGTCDGFVAAHSQARRTALCLQA